MNEDRASRYHRLRRRAAVAATAGGAAWLLALVYSGGAPWLVRVLAPLTGRLAPLFGAGVQIALFVSIAALGYEAIVFPFAVYRGFVLDRKYGLSSESLKIWLLDHFKAATVGLLLTLAAAIAIVYSVHAAGAWWWLLSAVLFTAAGVLIAVIAPVAVMPLFYRFHPLDRDGLRERLLELSERAGVRVLGAFEWGLGDRTTRANAALVGLGRTRRILVSDTLLKLFSDDEIEVILAHEIAHHVHRDLWAALAFESGAIAIGLAGAHAIILRWGAVFGVTSPGELAALPLIAVIVGAASLLLTPLRNAWSRRAERRADGFALHLTRRPAAFISAMRRLGAQNLADERPSPATFWFFHTHPTLDERIEAAKRFRAA
jgi:STE24 endopeptidase